MKKILIFIVVSCFFMVFLPHVCCAQKNTGTQKNESLRKGEKRATLDPSQFANPRVKEAYRVAKEIPWVLDSIYCYCFCEESASKHISLLSCYVDLHASV
ncbi:MAG: PCYCGC domain-containing protein [Nitrospiraceae bacterium]|nr:PCYCGC domain-containing protein [Nitrospiraceae bacterium]